MTISKIKSNSITDSAVSTEKLATNSITKAKVNNDIITAQTELAETANDGDFILVYDTSTSSLKKVLKSNFTLQVPTVTSVSPTAVVSGDGTGNYTFVITGTGFTAANANLINNSGTAVSFDTVTVNSATQITGVVAKSSLPGSGEPYDVKVVAASGLAATLANQINIDQSPVFSTAAGSLGSNRINMSSVTILAADPESAGDVVYTLEAGTLPAGITLASQSSGCVFTGNFSSLVSSDTTYNFTIRAKDAASNTSDRAFSFTALGPVTETFNSSGTFSVPTGVSAVEVLVIGAGGGVDANSYSGGGGAGGLVYVPSHSVTPGGTISVTVGAGAAGQTSTNQAQNTVFDTLTAYGGGDGGSAGSAGSPSQSSGGGGGGGSWGQSASSGGNSGPQGNPGGNGAMSTGTYTTGGGGGGSAGAGQNASGSSAGGGGVGTQNSITGSSVYYSGGGAGGTWTSNPSQTAVGSPGAGSTAFRTAVTQNRGNGASALASGTSAGSSGVVIVKY